MFFNTPRNSEPPVMRIDQFRGVNMGVNPTQIHASQSENSLNVLVDQKGALFKRTGYEKMFDWEVGTLPTKGLFHYRKSDGSSYILFATAIYIYKLEGKGEIPTVIYDEIQFDGKVSFFVMNDLCYIQDGRNLVVFDGTEVKKPTPYIPTLTMSGNLSTAGVDGGGGGELIEDINLLGPAFKEYFSGTGKDKQIRLSIQGLDGNKRPIVKVDNVEVTNFTYNGSAGHIDLVDIPPKGTNNVEVIAYRWTPNDSDINKCTFNVIYGGANDTRVWFAGNPDKPDYVWRSGLHDPTYWPENGFYKFDDKVTGFAKQYDYLIIEKENGKQQVSFSLTSAGLPTFSSKPLNDTVGTIARESVQIIENSPVSLSKNGVYMLVNSSVRDERNVTHISKNVDKMLLAEPNKENAVSIDHDKRYWLALNGRVYVLDYSLTDLGDRGEWFIFDNIHASCFITYGDDLLFGDSRKGMIYRFKKIDDLRPYNDDGEPINAFWKSKYMTFEINERRKLVYKVFYSMLPVKSSGVDIYYKTDKKVSGLLKKTLMSKLDFKTVNFNGFSFVFTDFPQTRAVKIKAKKITNFQLILESNRDNEGLGIASLGIKYGIQGEVK